MVEIGGFVGKQQIVDIGFLGPGLFRDGLFGCSLPDIAHRLDAGARLDPAEFVRLHRSTIARRGHIAGFRHDAGGAWLRVLAAQGGSTVKVVPELNHNLSTREMRDLACKVLIDWMRARDRKISR